MKAGRFTVFSLVAVFACSAAVHASDDKKRIELLGQRAVDFKAERDEIQVSSKEGGFTHLVFLQDDRQALGRQGDCKDIRALIEYRA
jgi:hypothetical protein